MEFQNLEPSKGKKYGNDSAVLEIVKEISRIRLERLIQNKMQRQNSYSFIRNVENHKQLQDML